MSNAENAYYLGGLVFVQETQNNRPKITVLDGQQRLATLYLLVAVLSKCFKELLKATQEDNVLDMEERLRFRVDLEQKLLALKQHRLQDNGEPILQMYYQDDKEHFNYCIKTTSISDLPTPLKSSHPIIKAFGCLYDEVNKFCLDESRNAQTTLDEHSAFQEVLIGLSEYVMGRSSEITYTTINEGQEFTIFETINNRGKNLNIYDLTRIVMINLDIKRDFNLNASEEFDNVIKKNTNPITNYFSQRNAEKLIIDNWNMTVENKIGAGKYMQAFSLFYKAPPSDGGFKKPGSQSKTNFKSFLDVLKMSSYAFAEILDPTLIIDSSLSGSNTEKLKLKKKIESFNLTKFKQFYSLYFALRNKNHTCEYIMKYIELIERAYVNIIFLFKGSPSTLEGALSRFAFDVYNATDTIENTFRDHSQLIANLINDFNLDFETQFSTITASNSQSNYILREISSKIASGVRPSMDSVHVEHIMPKKWEANWGNILFKDGVQLKEIDNEVCEEYLSRLGNFTLLLGSDNIPLSNSSYEKKLEKYNDETLAITQGGEDYSVTKYDKWDAESIEKRQAALGVVAKEIWGI